MKEEVLTVPEKRGHATPRRGPMGKHHGVSQEAEEGAESIGKSLYY